MPKPLVTDLSVGDKVATLFVIKQMALAPFKKKSGKYLTLTLGDRSGEIPARMWVSGMSLRCDSISR